MNSKRLLKIARFLERENLVEEARRIRKIAGFWEGVKKDFRPAAIGARAIVDVVTNPVGFLSGTAYRDAVISALAREANIPPAQRYQWTQDMQAAWDAAEQESPPPTNGTVQNILDWMGVPDIQAGFQDIYNTMLGDTSSEETGE